MSRRWVVVAFATVLFCVMPAVPASATGPTYVTANISTNTTWTLDGSPYIVNKLSLWINAGATLTIEPGVKVVMNYPTLGQATLVVQGQLQALGTQTAPIVFTSGQDHFGNAGARGQWRYIAFFGASTGTLAFTEIRYAGGTQSSAPYAYGALWMDSSVEVWVDHAWIHDNRNSGIKATSGAPIHVSGTVIEHNDIGVAAVGSLGGVVHIQHSRLSNNANYGLFTNHSSPPVMQSVITSSDIIHNGEGLSTGGANAGVRLQEAPGTLTPTERYPTGSFNNIWDNKGYDLSVLNARTNPAEHLWDNNYWGEDVAGPGLCPIAISPWPYHLVYIFDPLMEGPIQNKLWTQKPLACRSDFVAVHNFLAEEEPNLAPESDPW